MAEPTEQEIHMALRSFAEAFLQNLRESGENAEEAFEAYELALRADIHKDENLFKQRFIEGYFLLNKL